MKKRFLALALVALIPLLQGCNFFSGKSKFGKEKTFDGVELYHTDVITDAQADSLGDFLVAQKFADGKEKTVQITKAGNTYQFRFVVIEKARQDPSLPATMRYFASVLSSDVFHGAPVEVHMCDELLNTLKVFTYVDFGKETTFNGVQLYHTTSVTDAEVDSLGNYLVRSKFADGNPKTVQLTRPIKTYQFRFVIKAGLEKDQNFIANVKTFAAQLSTNVFKGEPVEIHLCNDQLVTLVVVPMH